MTAPTLTVQAVELYEWPFRLRMPFKFGVITATHGRQAVARVRVRLDNGREGWGTSAEGLGAKWFDKNPQLSDSENLDQLRTSLEIAKAAYLASGPRTAFHLFADHYATQLAEGGRRQLNPLVASYGPALLDRAVLDALCRLLGVSFYEAMRRNLAGMAPHAVAPDLKDFDIGAMLGSLKPASMIHARHTVGLVDPIVGSDQAPGSRVDDGLPETLEEVVSVYGHRYFKLKVGGDLGGDVDRLERIATVLDRIAEPYYASLDGNEQYENVAAVLALWRRIAERSALTRLLRSILFIEQPIKRQMALSASVAALSGQRPVIIDESDGDLDAFLRARSLGYLGVSSKTCKGFYKSILNLARCRMWNGTANGARYFLSAEDLTTQAGLSVQQDLALVNLLGLTHVERNGHHFIDGFCGRPEGEAFLKAHPDLYRRDGDRVRLRIAEGRIALGSLDCVGFAARAEPDFASLEAMPVSRWPH